MADDLILQALEAHYKAYISLKNDRQRAHEELAQINDAIATITPKIIGLSALVEVPEDSELSTFLFEIKTTGITDAIRSVLRSAGAVMLRPPVIKDQLIKMGLNLSGYQNPLAVIGSVLKRLEESGEVRKIPHKDGARYRWVRAEKTRPAEPPKISDVIKKKGK
ncbi:MAG TPA: hypothetical protein DC054_09395 [Blastocatellia bacterium]|nr:hypothetical protein [Blastocatellia bacterium]